MPKRAGFLQINLFIHILYFLFISLSLQATDGDLDTSFAGDGIVELDMGGANDQAHALAIQTDGKIIVAGYADMDVTSTVNNDFAVARFNTDGSLDTTFGTTGTVTTAFGTGDDEAYAVAIQTDEKIIVVGRAFNDANDMDFAIARYNTDGSLDSTFGTGGKVLTHFGLDADVAYAVAIQTDGKIVVGGQAFSPNMGSMFIGVSPSDNFALARYNTDGSLDTTFDGNGLVTTMVYKYEDGISDIVIQQDGKIVVVGTAGNGWSGVDEDLYSVAVARYNTDGSLDESFGIQGDGIVRTLTGVPEFGTGAVLQTDGKIVVSAHRGGDPYSRNILVHRYTTEGVLDPTFGTDGIVVTDLGTGKNEAHDIALQTDGKIVVAGEVDNGKDPDVGVLRYDSDGNLDTTFDGGVGIVSFPVTGDYDRAQAIAIQSNGKIVVAGYYLAVAGSLGTKGFGDFIGTATTNFFVARQGSSGSVTPPGVTLSLGGGNGLVAEDGGVETLTATLSEVSGQDVTIDLSFGGTATLTADYTRSGTQIVIPAGSLTGNVTVTGVQDAIDEPNETIVIDIDMVTNGTETGSQQVTTTIIDDDAVPAIAFDSITLDGSESLGTVCLDVDLSQASSQVITVDYSAIGGTATGGGVDYLLLGTTLTFNPGETTQSICMGLVNDTLDETDETIEITLNNPVNTNLTKDPTHTFTIVDDDGVPAQIPTIKITANNQYTLYVNGKKIGENNDFKSVETYNVPNLKVGDIIAIKAQDTGWQGAVACQIDHPDGVMVSNFTWHAVVKKSLSKEKGWNQSGFDISMWPRAFEHHTMDEQNIYGSFKEFDPSVRWIWTRRKYHDNEIYLVTKFKPDQNAMLGVTADNSFNLYLNGTSMGKGSDWTHVEFYPTTLKTGDVIAIEAQNKGKGGGLLGWVKWRDDQGETHEFGTDETWQLSTTKENGWKTQAFNDSHWMGATAMGRRGMAPWKKEGTLINIPKTTKWIWNEKWIKNKNRKPAKAIWVRKAVP